MCLCAGQQSLHGRKRSAHVRSQGRIEVVRKGQIRIQGKTSLERLLGTTKIFGFLPYELSYEAVDASQTCPRRCIPWVRFEARDVQIACQNHVLSALSQGELVGAEIVCKRSGSRGHV